MNELQIEIAKQGEIVTNLDALKADLTEIAERHKGVIVTEDNLPLAKKDLAELRKTVKEVEDRRKAVKKEWSKPYEAFEKQIKDILAIINSPIEEIDKQVKEFEAQEKSLKEQHCREIYEQAIGEYAEYLPFGSIFKDSWLNKSTKDTDIIADLSVAKTQIVADMTAIKALQSEFESEVIEAYKSSGNNLASAIQRNQQLISAKQLAEKKADEEAQAKIEAERKAREEAEQRAIEAEKKVEDVHPLPFEGIGIFTVRPKTNEEHEQLKQFLELADIQYSVVY